MSVDYDQIADTYDAGRFHSPEKAKFWSEKLAEYGDLRSGSRVLDIGCGTGRFALPLADQLSCQVWGLDISRRMLEKAKGKTLKGLCYWIQGDAQSLPFSQKAFDLCLLSMMIHHVKNQEKSLRETYRVLVPGGKCIIRTCSHEQLKRLPDYFFFPSAYRIDSDRIPDVPVLRATLISIGFSQVIVEEVMSPSQDSAAEYLAKVRNKYTSTFRLIPERDFSKGLAKAERYFSEHPYPGKWKKEPISLVLAGKG